MRRTSLLALVGAFLLIPSALAMAGQTKTDMCHANSNGYQLISIAEPAVDAHIAHGDAAPGEPVPGMDGYEFDATCEPIPVSELIFAVAYMDVNDDGTGYNATQDLLIAKLVDANGDGVPGAGDKVVTAHYPLGFGSPLAGHGDFATTDFVITRFASFDGTCLAGQGVPDEAGSPTFLWQVKAIMGGGSYEGYSEYHATSSDLTSFEDRIGAAFDDQMTINVDSPSKPATDLIWQAQFSDSDDPFVDVELNCL